MDEHDLLNDFIEFGKPKYSSTQKEAQSRVDIMWKQSKDKYNFIMYSLFDDDFIEEYCLSKCLNKVNFLFMLYL
jgi:hypothetical protein